MKNKVTKVLNIVVDVLVILVLIVSAFILISVLTTTHNGNGVPNLLGKAPISVLTDSMKGNRPDNFVKGDLLICDVVNPDAENTYREGDIVTFRFDVDGDEKEDLVTHRIYRIDDDGSYQTKGDNNLSYDQDPNNTLRFGNIYPSDIMAVYHGTRIPGVGKVFDFLRTPLGFFLVVLLPMIIFFIYQAVRVIMNAVAYSKEKAVLAAQEELSKADLSEEQKQKVIDEYLAAQRGEKTVDSEPATDEE